MTLEMIAHIGAGATALLCGAVALIARKGARLHRTAGTVFVVAMLTMATLGAWIAVLMPQRGTVVIGILTFYLVFTAWLTMRRRPGEIGVAEYVAFVVGAGCAVAMLVLGQMAQASPNPRVDALPFVVHYGFAFVMTIAALSDIAMFVRGGVSGRARTARHLWRMCTALLTAAISFFLGQQNVLPEFLRKSPAIFLPELTILGLMIYWLIRTWLPARRKPAPQPAE
jgi:uncharacterized membrane protein